MSLSRAQAKGQVSPNGGKGRQLDCILLLLYLITSTRLLQLGAPQLAIGKGEGRLCRHAVTHLFTFYQQGCKQGLHSSWKGR